MMRALLVLAGSLLLWTQAAWGHASLVSASPAPGAVLERPPAAIVLRFNEPVGVTVLRLFGPQGQPVPTGPVSDRGNEIRIPLASGGGRGTYLLSWRIVSADGHPVGGTLDYSVGAASAAGAGVASQAGEPSRSLAIWLVRCLAYLCLFAGVGAAVFRLIDAADRPQAWARPPIILGLALLPLGLGLQGLDLQDAPWAELARPGPWLQAIGGTYAMTLGLLGLALLAAAVAVGAAARPVVRAAAPLGLLLAGAALAVSGHAGTAPPRWLSRPAVVLHVMTAIAWIGLLIPLARSLRRHPPRPGGALGARATGPLARFSRGIAPVVALLVLSGVVLAFLQLDHLHDLWRTGYGRVLAAKLCLVALLFALAAHNRWNLTRPALAGDGPAIRRLRGAIRAELVLAVAVLAVVSLWRFTPPPRSLDARAGTGAVQAGGALVLADGRVRAVLDPVAGGWAIRLARPDGGPFEAQGVTVAVSRPDLGIEPLRRPAQRLPDGSWRVSLPVLPPGQGRIELTVLVDDFDQITLQTASVPAQSGHPHSLDHPH
ncbi:MAG TPA: copper resistance protein CopC [Castellaniella sp.]|nr:copper resistance protein CopC [Castellaniella sp.]